MYSSVMSRRIILIFILILMSFTCFADENLFRQARALQHAGEYDEAIEAYKTILLQPIDEKRLGYRIHIGGKHHQRIHIGHRRAHKAVAAGQDLFHHALTLFLGDLHDIAGKGTFSRPAQRASAAAGDQPLIGLYIIKAT